MKFFLVMSFLTSVSANIDTNSFVDKNFLDKDADLLEQLKFWGRELQTSIEAPSLSPKPSIDSAKPSTSSSPTTEIPPPSVSPSVSLMPTVESSTEPSVSSKPSSVPSVSIMPTTVPSSTPTISAKPSSEIAPPSLSPSVSSMPSLAPSDMPSVAASAVPTTVPTAFPTDEPTVVPSEAFSDVPTVSMMPSLKCGIPPTTRREQILSTLSGTVSDPALLSDNTQPQYAAAEWLIGGDAYFVCPDDPKMIQRYVMALFYYSTIGDEWASCSANFGPCTDTRYLSPVHECEWFGHTCNADLCITEIEFESNNVDGTIPFELEQLKDLEVLSLEQGGIALTIPSELGTLSNLRILDLDFNIVTGTIPEEIYGLTSLEQLDLNSNKLTGTISNSVGSLQNLRLLQIYENLMTGTIPEALGTVESLVIGEFFNNTFTGVMPASVCANRAPPVGTGAITGLTSDCFPFPVPQLLCTCCTGCAAF